MGYKRENVLVTKNNLPMKARNQDLYRPNTTGRGLTLNLLDGEPYAYDPKTRKTIDATDLTSVGRYEIGVGIDTNGDGWADDIRRIAGDAITSCDIIGITADPASCSVVQVSDFLFSCTPSQQDYSLTISVDNSKVRSSFATNRTADYEYNFRYNQEGCDTCTIEDSCSKVVCGLVNTINGVPIGDPFTTPYFYGRQRNVETPFTAVRLFGGVAASKDFCISFEETTCPDCTFLSRLYSITVGGVITVFENASTTVDEEIYTLPAQLQGIVDQMNTALGETGSAVLLDSNGACCAKRIQINSCETVTVQSAVGVNITPCATSNPFAALPVENTCPDCGDDPVTVTYTCGIRVFFLAPQFPCDCLLPGVNNPPNFYGTQGWLRPNSETWTDGSFAIVDVAKMVLPKGLGYQLQIREYAQNNGGQGRGYNNYNVHKGRIGLPVSRLDRFRSAVTAKCNELYCIVNLLVAGTKREVFANDSAILKKSNNLFAIPQGDTVTQESVLTFLNTAAGTSGCSNLTTVSCAEEADPQTYNAVHDK
jgi:rubredoxin